MLRAIAHNSGGRVVLVIGAGTSIEAPTCLPLSADCSREAHRQLLHDNVLATPCSDPTDLFKVADDVFATTGSQTELVKRLPRIDFLQATPNRGHLLAAAMLFEGAIGNVITLNYDLSMTNAISQIGCKNSVSIIQGPEDHLEMSHTNLIYLHRSANADPNQWILRSSVLEEAWRDGWEGVVSNMVLASPLIVFIGLGSPATVLTENISRIRSALKNKNEVLYVSPGDYEESEFFASLDLSADSWLSMGWIDFTVALSIRLAEEQAHYLMLACEQLARKLDIVEDGLDVLCERLAELGLLFLGNLRAKWFLSKHKYVTMSNDRNHWMADLILALAYIQRVGHCDVIFNHDGTVEIQKDERILTVLILANARGIFRWSEVEERLARREPRIGPSGHEPRTAIIAGVPEGRGVESSLPIDIVGENHPESIIGGSCTIDLFSVDEIRKEFISFDRILS